MLRLWPLAVALGVGALVLVSTKNAPKETLSPLAALGRDIFNDATLSASGQQSCATCHQSAYGHASARGIEAGGPDMQAMGQRNVPSIRYVSTRNALSFDADGKASGGFFWDGRAASLQAQALQPFLNPLEMANPDAASVVQKLSRSSYAARFSELNGTAIWQQPERAFAAMADALAAYQQEDTDFHRFDSRFDQVMQGRARFSAAEQRGWALFKDEEKGNCAACHTAEPGVDGKPPLFTDNSYDNLGVPRHPALRRPQQSVDHDLGLCKNTSLPKDVPIATLCGAFKVPSLRNVAVRKAFFHNAAITDLREVLAFYATRDTDPNRWYGKGQVFNDLPLKYQSNVNRSEVPYDRKPGEQPRLSEQDIDDVLAFLQTLTDADLADSVAKRRSATAAANAVVRVDRLAASPRAANTP